MHTADEMTKLKNVIKKPAPGRVVLVKDTAQTVTEKGIFLPEATKAENDTGVIVNVGPVLSDFQHEFEIGERAFFGKYAGTPLGAVINGEKVEVWVMAADDIQGVLGDETEVEGMEKAVSA